MKTVEIDTTGISNALGMAPLGVIPVEVGGTSTGAPKGEMHAFFGQKHTEESKALLRKKRAGKRPSLGMKHTEEAKAAMSANRKGKKRPPRDPEWCLKISESKKGKATQTGRKRTPEQRLNMSNAAKARYANKKTG